MKSRFLLVPLVLSFFTCSCSITEDDNNLLVLGTDIRDSRGTSAFSLVAKELKLDYVSSLIKNRDRYEDTFDYLNKNPTIREGESVTNVHELIDESRIIIVNFSLNNVARHIQKEEEGMTYDKRELEADISLFDYYLNSICDCIYELEDEANVLFLSILNPYVEAKSYVNEFNSVIRSNALKHGGKYIDISKIEIDNGSVSTTGVHQLAKDIVLEVS